MFKLSGWGLLNVGVGDLMLCYAVFAKAICGLLVQKQERASKMTGGVCMGLRNKTTNLLRWNIQFKRTPHYKEGSIASDVLKKNIS